MTMPFGFPRPKQQTRGSFGRDASKRPPNQIPTRRTLHHLGKCSLVVRTFRRRIYSTFGFNCALLYGNQATQTAPTTTQSYRVRFSGGSPLFCWTSGLGLVPLYVFPECDSVNYCPFDLVCSAATKRLNSFSSLVSEFLLNNNIIPRLSARMLIALYGLCKSLDNCTFMAECQRICMVGSHGLFYQNNSMLQ